ncbi:MAG: glycosyltransferase family 4 protein [Vicinamibacterales bacterium]
MTAPLRVGMDGRAWTSPAAGVRRYTRELVQALLGLDEPLTIVALGGDGDWPRAVERWPETWHPPTNLGWTAIGLARLARAAHLDVYHGPAYTAPPFGVSPIVLTIHDVSYARHPEWYPWRLGPVRRWFYRASATAARLVITDSAFSRAEIGHAYGVPADTIRVIPLGVSPVFAPDPAAPLSTRAGAPYVLHVGDLHARRNLEVALDAVLRLRARHPALRLVLAGVDRGEGARLMARAVASGAPEALQMAGPVSEPALVDLYRGARALVYPSRYEGFGLPMVEAMRTGTPVIAASGATAEEVLGDAGVIVPPDDGAAWVAALGRLLEDAAAARACRERGLARAREFDWGRTARATLAVYREAAAR